MWLVGTRCIVRHAPLHTWTNSGQRSQRHAVSTVEPLALRVVLPETIKTKWVDVQLGMPHGIGGRPKRTTISTEHAPGWSAFTGSSYGITSVDREFRIRLRDYLCRPRIQDHILCWQCSILLILFACSSTRFVFNWKVEKLTLSKYRYNPKFLDVVLTVDPLFNLFAFGEVSSILPQPFVPRGPVLKTVSLA